MSRECDSDREMDRKWETESERDRNIDLKRMNGKIISNFDYDW